MPRGLGRASYSHFAPGTSARRSGTHRREGWEKELRSYSDFAFSHFFARVRHIPVLRIACQRAERAGDARLLQGLLREALGRPDQRPCALPRARARSFAAMAQLAPVRGCISRAATGGPRPRPASKKSVWCMFITAGAHGIGDDRGGTRGLGEKLLGPHPEIFAGGGAQQVLERSGRWPRVR